MDNYEVVVDGICEIDLNEDMIFGVIGISVIIWIDFEEDDLWYFLGMDEMLKVVIDL